MKFILGIKQNMVQMWDKDGKCFPATILASGIAVVTQVKTVAKDGYSAVQIGFGEKNERNINKPLKGHLKEAGNVRYIREFRVTEEEAVKYNVGDKINISAFAEGDAVEASGFSKGKGFQGVVKRYGFAGGRRSHGQKHSEREPGSIGATGPQRVFKGTRMAGRMGNERVTVKNLKVLGVDTENEWIVISGAIPGRRGTLIEIKG